jgi:lysophospholipase L1-like esterase
MKSLLLLLLLILLFLVSNASALNLIFEGDSLTSGGTYPFYTAQILNATCTNIAVPGEQMAQIIHQGNDADSRYNSSARNVIVLWAGTNDLHRTQRAPEAIHGEIRDWCRARQEKGFQVIVVTILPRSDPSNHPTFENDRQKLNTLIRENYGSYADGLADVAADARIGNMDAELEGYYYLKDRVHLTDRGYYIVAEIVARAISRQTIHLKMGLRLCKSLAG